jgi:hypothetical protein
VQTFAYLPFANMNDLVLPSFSAESCPPVTTPLAGDPSWDEAFLRVESYLRAHQLESRVLLNQLASDIIREARERVCASPAEEPVFAAMNVTNTRIGVWFARAGNAGDWSDERVREGGRLALVLTNLPERWANCFLSTEPVPPEFAAALAAGTMQPGPEMRFSNMAAAPLEFGFADPADPGSPARGGWASMRAAATWLLIAGLYGSAWAASH